MTAAGSGGPGPVGEVPEVLHEEREEDPDIVHQIPHLAVQPTIKLEIGSSHENAAIVPALGPPILALAPAAPGSPP